MMIKIMILFLATQTSTASPNSGSGTVPGTYPPLPRKYWVPVRRPPSKNATKQITSGKGDKNASQGSNYEESPVDLLTPEERVTVMGGRSMRDSLPLYHTVSAGETLWEISARYYGDPWEWPKLWAMNPHVTNPHWLFPGTRIYLKPHTTSRSQTNTPVPVAGARPVDRFLGLRLSDVDESIRNLAVVDMDATRAGTIEGSLDGRMLISEGDKVYVRNLHRDYSAPGITLGIYRIMGPVTEPGTGRKLGVLVRIRGEGRIIKKTDGTAVLEVTDCIAPIGKGDYVGPIPHKFLDVRVTPPPSKKIRARVSRGFLHKTMYASGDLVVLSAGKTDGVKVGMPFLVAVRGRGGFDASILPMEQQGTVERKGGNYPWEVESRGIILYTHDHISIGILRKSYLPVRLGDDVLMGPWEGVR